jgi:hypothetical protein
MMRRILDHKSLIIIFLHLLIVLTLLYCISTKEYEYKHADSQVTRSEAIPLLHTQNITQRFFNTLGRNLGGIAICFGTYYDARDCNITVSVRDVENNEEIFNSTVNAKQLKDNQYQNFLFDTSSDILKSYEIILSTDSKSLGDSIAIWAGKNIQNNADLQLDVGKEIMPHKSIDFGLLNKNEFNLYFARFSLPVIIAFAVLFLLTFKYKYFFSSPREAIIYIYLMFFLFFAVKMSFYNLTVGRFPDEGSHISYLAYLEKNDNIMPVFKNMKQLEVVADGSKYNAVINGSFPDSAITNQLMHPPLYYHILKLVRAIQVDGENFSINLFRLRLFSMALSSVALLCIFYLGFSKLDAIPILHLVYGVTVTSIPMFAYIGTAVNNDVLSFFGVILYLFGALGFIEGSRKIHTFLLIAVGFFICCMAKLTTAIPVILTTVALVVMTIKKHKSLVDFKHVNFIITLPFYIIVILYFIAVFHQTGSIQPSLKSLNIDDFYNSSFYNKDGAQDVKMAFYKYIPIFIGNFLETWTGVVSHVSLRKSFNFFNINQIALLCIWLFQFLFYFLKSKKIEYRFILIMCHSVLVTIVIQFYNSYHHAYLFAHNIGGYQSRYYLCFLPALVLPLIWYIQSVYSNIERNSTYSLRKKKILHTLVISFCIIFSSMLVYEDFIYFLLHFRDYLLS